MITESEPISSDARRSRTIVLVHAFPLDSGMWEQSGAITAKHRLLVPNVYGFGGSDLPEAGWSIEDYADRLVGWLDELKIREPVIFGGLSMGGYVALAFAKKYPERIRGLILADTRAEADSDEAKANRDKTIAAMATQTPADLIEQMIPKMLCKTTCNTNLGVVAKVKEMGGRQTRAGVVAGLKALRDRSDSTASLKTFRFPVLVIVGAEDALTPPALSEAMVKELPNATLEVILNAGHLSNLEQPEAFNEIILKWLTKLQSGGTASP